MCVCVCTCACMCSPARACVADVAQLLRVAYIVLQLESFLPLFGDPGTSSEKVSFQKLQDPCAWKGIGVTFFFISFKLSYLKVIVALGALFLLLRGSMIK